MSSVVLALIIGAMSQAAPEVSAPAGFEPLVAAPSSDLPERLCSSDGAWCVAPPEPEDPNIYIDRGTSGAPSYWSPPEGDGWHYALQRFIAPLKAGGALLLMKAERTVGYSGGGGNFENYVVLHVAPTGAVQRVMTAPQSGNLMIRACFGEDDFEQRAGACHDEYRLVGALSLDDDGSETPPLRIETNAEFFPRGIRRDQDSLSLPPLTESDLVWTTDPICTYRRVFTYDAQKKDYTPDSPLPDCDQYLKD